MQNEWYDLSIGDLVEIYSPLSMHHGYYAVIVSAPSTYGVYKVLIQEEMEERSFAYGELERIN